MNQTEPSIAIVGAGQFASYFCIALRRGGFGGQITVSNFNLQRARALATAIGGSVAQSPRQLTEHADWVLLAVRPEQCEEALAELTLYPHQTVISAIAGLTIAQLRTQLRSVGKIVRIMPSSYIEAFANGIIPQFPADGEVERILAQAGRVIPLAREEELDLAMIGACLSGWFYAFAGDIVDWFATKGISEARARDLVLGNIEGALAASHAMPNAALADIAHGIATPGTFTKLGLDHLLTHRRTAFWSEALDATWDKVQQTDRH